MPWPVPQPTDIADRAAGIFESELARIWSVLNPGAPPPVIDARSPRSVEAVYARVLGLTGFDLWLFLAWLAREIMPNTARDWLARHAAIRGIPRVQPQSAFGNLVLTGAPTTVIPMNYGFAAPGNTVYEAINAGTIDSSGTIGLGVSAAVAGSAGNLAPGVTLTTVSPLGGLYFQTGTIDSNGVTGGADIEDIEVWRQRILKRWRERGRSGNKTDFEQWVQEVLPTALVLAISPTAGVVTVAFAMPGVGGYRVPTTSEISEVTAYLNDATQRKPLGVPVVYVIAATLQPVNVTLHLNPDTPATRQGTEDALTLYFPTDLAIGGTLELSRLEAAINAAAGVYNFDLSAPSGDASPSTATSLLTLGTVTFT